MRGQERGFTLIELVVVITILGILAAVALPKFVNVQKDARLAALDGIASSVHGAANLVYAKALIAGVETAPTASAQTVAVQGGTVTVNYGFPTADTIAQALTLDGVSVSSASTTATFELQSGCAVSYNEPAAVGGSYTVAVTASAGC